ncbi:DUF3368 domain-containing protein [Telluribacter sp.]|jgi:hypothetical protein|uniref:DUF3368 domain-containing protein n=1 Tax=Telluribacter sp. TaxID=1978767 RepID=UPI002E15B86B|nr:DUF3368 domain-containing protein [Telluribacter sp.]
MPEVVIADTSCFIFLTNIGALNLLQNVYGSVTTTAEVADEYALPLPDWVYIKFPANKVIQQVLELQIDKGESSTIALALEIPGCTVILDDYKARQVAEKLNLKITGTVGLLVKAKLTGIIPSIRPFLSKIRQSNFRLSNKIEEEALRLAGE